MRGVGGGSGRSLGKTAKISAPAGLSTGKGDRSMTWAAGAAEQIAVCS